VIDPEINCSATDLGFSASPSYIELSPQQTGGCAGKTKHAALLSKQFFKRVPATLKKGEDWESYV
jgi:hypothetical protein